MRQQRFEYHIFQAYKDEENVWEDVITQERLNEWGKEGWRVVSAHWSYELGFLHITSALLERALLAEATP